MSEASQQEKTGIDYLVDHSPCFQRTISDLRNTSAQSVTGITNFVINHENPLLVDHLLRRTFAVKKLFNGTHKIDAVDLQNGRPGKGASVRYLDELIYGKYKVKEDKNGDAVPDVDEQTGVINRVENGLVNRASLGKSKEDGGCEDKTLIINNIDYCLDFCKMEDPAIVDTRALFLLDRFRHPEIKNRCTLVLISNKKLDLPFEINTVEISPVKDFEVKHIINVFIKIYRDKNVLMLINESEVNQIVRKLVGSTYSQACDALWYCLRKSKTKNAEGRDMIDMNRALRILRKKINESLMASGFGLSQLEARPWEDYICPEESNFTYDVNKLMRDFKEVDSLKGEIKEASTSLKGAKKSKKNFEDGLVKIGELEKTIEALETRMPHIIVLHGQGGVGKSAFPIHLAGLLEMDVWDFNINATHSKWIGQGSEQMRESLQRINQSSHIIVRIDEYDRAMGSTNERGGGMHEAHKQVESEFMNWLQNSQEENIFQKRNIFVVMTTNHVANITGPMLRSGRADLVIDIGSFDAASMLETFSSSARRMDNRGVSVTGFQTPEALQAEIDGLDLKKLSELATTKKFTVRDVEMLIQEMAGHRYYFNKYGGENGIPWTTEAFVKVLENSEGSVKGETTGELKLGDRDYYKDDPEDLQVEFESSVTDLEKLKTTKGFQEE